MNPDLLRQLFDLGCEYERLRLSSVYADNLRAPEVRNRAYALISCSLITKPVEVEETAAGDTSANG